MITMQSKIWFTCFLLLACLSYSDGLCQEDNDQTNQFPYEILSGPQEINIVDIANVYLPEGYIFVGEEGTQAIMEMMGNPVSGMEVGYVEPDSGGWFMLFEFEEIGYVNDDEKDALDTEAMLESIKEATEQSNEVRRSNGWPTLTVLDWYQSPNYSSETNNLEWAIRGINDSSIYFINHNTRILGRFGIMHSTLVIGPETIDYELPVYKEILSSFSFNLGNTYAEFQDGDKIAEYGLTALVVGGAAAVAAKSGLFKWLWKILVVAFAAGAGFFRKLFGKKKKSNGPFQS